MTWTSVLVAIFACLTSNVVRADADDDINREVRKPGIDISNRSVRISDKSQFAAEPKIETVGRRQILTGDLKDGILTHYRLEVDRGDDITNVSEAFYAKPNRRLLVANIRSTTTTATGEFLARSDCFHSSIRPSLFSFINSKELTCTTLTLEVCGGVLELGSALGLMSPLKRDMAKACAENLKYVEKFWEEVAKYASQNRDYRETAKTEQTRMVQFTKAIQPDPKINWENLDSRARLDTAPAERDSSTGAIEATLRLEQLIERCQALGDQYGEEKMGQGRMMALKYLEGKKPKGHSSGTTK